MHPGDRELTTHGPSPRPGSCQWLARPEWRRSVPGPGRFIDVNTDENLGENADGDMPHRFLLSLSPLLRLALTRRRLDNVGSLCHFLVSPLQAHQTLYRRPRPGSFGGAYYNAGESRFPVTPSQAAPPVTWKPWSRRAL